MDEIASSPFLRTALACRKPDDPAVIASVREATPIGDRTAGNGSAIDAAGLRRLRTASLAEIAVRSLRGEEEVEQTLIAASRLAERCIGLALRGAEVELGLHVPGFCVLALGKLGGDELNFSSDVDLIFGFDQPAGEEDEQTRQRAIALSQQLTRWLAEVTADGFVYRVDTLLRPFGSAGALAMSFAAMEHYYQRHGREWERYALIKARPAAGDLGAGSAFLQRLQPFIYRRYLDFEAIENLRDLRARIEADARARDRQDDLKIGPGGIREIEFIVQLFQLMRGGQEPRLRGPRLLPVLRALGQGRYLPPDTAAALERDYLWLRRCENAVQMWADQQTHRLPRDADAREFVRRAMAAPDWEALLEQHAALRRRVRREFENTFAAPRSARQADELPALIDTLLLETGDREAATGRLAGLGCGEQAEAVARAIIDLSALRRRGGLGDRGWTRLKRLLPELLRDGLATESPGTGLLRALEIVKALAGRTTYLSLLQESTGARAQLLRLCAASPWITQQLIQAPALLDALLDPRTLYAPPQRDELAAAVAAAAHAIADDDLEGQMDCLRRFRQEMMLRIAASDLAAALPIYQVSDRLTWLAEAVLAQTLSFAWAGIARQWGTPPDTDRARSAFAVIGYGKLGGIELGYGSDLDLIFLYDRDPEAETQGGSRRCSAAEFHARLAQRIVSLLTTQTARGRAYAVDLELRPSGRSGLLVSRLSGFERYQLESAWTWEQQALLRARPVAGDERIGERFRQIRRQVLCRARDDDTLRHEIAAMRDKMRAARTAPAGGRWDVKHAAGGLIDAEFLIQHLCLLHAATHPQAIEFTDNWRQIEALAAAGLLPPSDAQALIEAGRAMRAHLHRRALQQADDSAAESELAAERETVQRLWRRRMRG
ncbi:MAG: bifunctional [glutamate--ammonia ligase]-adenylyl-L-tyrosine phosphorylase/[glutamate--ammonia-ligase] adenylyltransferase [Gammaproteobacteria bacterium]|nr:bifunctional [glutamate--ammonia ligase]-adenylyl-L-tyrosine phosphorylase/[glutamate--ammonia-ligase] adenylyltransferase [Gammaproteobacteria bacterium]